MAQIAYNAFSCQATLFRRLTRGLVSLLELGSCNTQAFTLAILYFHLPELSRREMPASIDRGASRVPRIIQRLRAPAMISALPASIAS